jgi:uncharacterized RDD family membrane protein YckC
MDRQYGSWGARAGALILDGLIVGVVCALLFSVFGISGLTSWLLWLVVGSGYAGLTMTRSGERNGQTLGKQAANLRVVRDDGQPVGWTTALLRETGLKAVGWWVTLGVGAMLDVLWPLGERERRSLHDLIMHTHVLDTNPAPQPTWAPPLPRLAPPRTTCAGGSRRWTRRWPTTCA